MGYPERCDLAAAKRLTQHPTEFRALPHAAGKKISIALEEMGLAHTLKPVNIGSNVEQFTEEFKAINPNSKIPAIGASAGRRNH